ncbi:hypothetical protein CRG98_017733, partial [Punica granatum]
MALPQIFTNLSALSSLKMEERHPNSTYFITIFIISGLLSTVGKSSKPYANSTEFPAPLPNDLSSLPNLFANELRLDPDSINLASTDYGNIVR